jgi:Glycosyl transferase family 11
MFQYAAGRALAEQKQEKLKIDLSFLMMNKMQNGDFVARPYELGLFPEVNEQTVDVEQLHLPSIVRRIKKKLQIGQFPVYHEPTFQFTSALSELELPVLIDGYWQSEKYFIAYEELIRRIFRFPTFSSADESNALLSELKQLNAVSVHVRRGDYLNSQILQLHGLCSLSYYQTAIAYIQAKFPDAVFCFFSDDIEWVKQELVQLTPNYRIAEGNGGTNAWKDMCLMSNCKHHIIANSSFSWWGAWLNPDAEKTVIAPKQWFNTTDAYYATTDLLPDRWMKM